MADERGTEREAGVIRSTYGVRRPDRGWMPWVDVAVRA